ncbi:MAG: hypothetical protein E7354_04750 [Clostridiales bacterium]|nr:hypothetical protein [Clostridiales bacterium]
MSILRNRIKRVRKRINSDPWEYDKKGRAIVEINVSDADSLMSVYDSDGKEVLSNETANFIDNAIKGIPPKKELHLYVACESYTKDKEQLYRNAIINYYVNEFADKDEKMKSNWIWSSILLIVAFLGFGILYALDLGGVMYTVSYLLDIGFWVLAWEAVDIMVLQQRELRHEQKKDLKIIFSTITFNRLEIPEEDEE